MPNVLAAILCLTLGVVAGGYTVERVYEPLVAEQSGEITQLRKEAFAQRKEALTETLDFVLLQSRIVTLEASLDRNREMFEKLGVVLDDKVRTKSIKKKKKKKRRKTKKKKG